MFRLRGLLAGVAVATSAAVALGSGASSAAVAPAAPAIIILHGNLVAERIVMTDWDENHRFIQSIDVGGRLDVALTHDRQRIRLAMFWGPEWAQHPRTPEALGSLLPEQANQHGAFYPHVGGRAPVVLLGPTLGRNYGTVSAISADGIEILDRHGVPVAVRQ
jgi:NAD(P)H-hydrate repair Nnr-like enzyme with NAD(P)H-hydrate dehydratase domain